MHSAIINPLHPSQVADPSLRTNAQKRPAPSRSEYVKTLFTMSNNQSRATTALTFSMPPSVNPMPKLQTVKPVFAATTFFPAPTARFARCLRGTYVGSWWSRFPIFIGRLLVEPPRS